MLLVYTCPECDNVVLGIKPYTLYLTNIVRDISKINYYVVHSKNLLEKFTKLEAGQYYKYLSNGEIEKITLPETDYEKINLLIKKISVLDYLHDLELSMLLRIKKISFFDLTVTDLLLNEYVTGGTNIKKIIADKKDMSLEAYDEYLKIQKETETEIVRFIYKFRKDIHDLVSENMLAEATEMIELQFRSLGFRT